MRILLTIAMVLAVVFTVDAQKKGEKTVVFNANLHCVSCKNKVEKNIPYEKGVKDLKVNMETNTITIVFLEAKNSVENLQKSIEKLGIQIKGIAGEDAKKDKEKKEDNKTKPSKK